MEYKLRLIIIGVALCLLPAVTLGDSVVKTLYIDGVLIAEVNEPNDGLDWPNDRVTIGAEGSRWYMYNEYVGKLDDFAIYDGVLSQAQVLAHWNARGNYTTYQAAVSDDSPLLWLKLDETDTNDGMVANNSGSEDYRDGEYVALDPEGAGIIISPTAGFVAGSNGVDLNANGRIAEMGDANGVCIDVWDGGEFSTELTSEGDTSIELWANYTDLNDYPRFFQHNGDWQQSDGYSLEAVLNDANTLVVKGGGVARFIDTVNDLNDGQWHHIVVTFDSTYIEVPPPPTLPYPNEVALDNPVLWLRFEDTDPCDSSGNNYWVEYGGGTSIVGKVGGIGNCLRLGGGTANYAAAANGPNVPTSNTDLNDLYAFAPNDITIEMWYKTFPAGETQPEEYAYFFQQSGVAGNDTGPGAGPYGTQILVLRGGAWWSGVNPKKDGQWHHLVVTFDEEPNSLEAQIYRDGELENTSAITGTTAKLGPELSHMMIGARNDRGYTYNNFIGYVDEFAIYEGLLDPNRIAIHYAAFQPENCAEVVERGWASGTLVVIDRNQDCRIDFFDFAIFAEQWALCNEPGGGTGCSANW